MVIGEPTEKNRSDACFLGHQIEHAFQRHADQGFLQDTQAGGMDKARDRRLAPNNRQTEVESLGRVYGRLKRPQAASGRKEFVDRRLGAGTGVDLLDDHRAVEAVFAVLAGGRLPEHHDRAAGTRP